MEQGEGGLTGGEGGGSHTPLVESQGSSCKEVHSYRKYNKWPRGQGMGAGTFTQAAAEVTAAEPNPRVVYPILTWVGTCKIAKGCVIRESNLAVYCRKCMMSFPGSGQWRCL